MSYKKNIHHSKDWREWKCLNGNTILKLGLPETVIKSEANWNYFLEHGYDADTGWDPNLLNKSETKALLDFLQLQYPERESLHYLFDIAEVLK